MIIQDSLGGNAKTAFVITISPSSQCAEETYCSLKFADRAKYFLLFLPPPFSLAFLCYKSKVIISTTKSLLFLNSYVDLRLVTVRASVNQTMSHNDLAAQKAYFVKKIMHLQEEIQRLRAK